MPACSSPQDSHHLWTCIGICRRSYHAACIGIKRGFEENLQHHVLPVCSQCRSQLHMDIEIRKILQHQLEGSHSILTHIKTNDKTNQEALNELHTKILNLQEDIKKSAETANKIYTAIVTQSPASDITLAEVKKAIVETTTHQNHKLAESFGRIQEITSSHRDDIIKTITSAEKCPSDIILAVHDEVRALTSSINDFHEKEKEVHHKTLADELNAVTEIELQPGWRLIGSKKIWKPDWTDYDKRQQTRRHQEKEADKARRRQRKHRQQMQEQQQQQQQQRQQQQQQRQHLQQQTNCNFDTGRNFRPSNHFNLDENANISNNNDNAISSNFLTLPSTKLSDKQLLDKARIEFSGHLPASATSNFINFRKGETINPYQAEKTSIVPPINSTTPQPTTTATNPELTDSMFCLDPLKPPIVRLTEQSACGDGKFLLARLREPHVYQNIRLYLAFLKDQPLDYCTPDGMTLTSMKAYLHSQGLPKSDDQLLSILKEFHSAIGLPETHTLADLEAFRKHMSSRKIQQLQKLREDHNKFFRPSNFTKY